MTNTLWAALVKAQAEFDKIAKDRTNPHFRSKYATMSSIIDATRPALTANGLAVTQIMEPGAEGVLVLKTILAHSSGEKVGSVVPLLALGKGAQPFGSELTYMRRYSYAAILNVVADEDDDGNTAQGAHKEDASPVQFQRREAAAKPPSVRDDTDLKRKARTWLDAELRAIAAVTTQDELTYRLKVPDTTAKVAWLAKEFTDLAQEYQEAIDLKSRELSNNEVMGSIPV